MKNRHLLKNAIKIAVTVILILFLFQKVNVDDLKKAAGMVRKKDLCVSIVIYMTSVMVNAFKWRILLLDISIMQLMKTCFKAQFYAIVLPGQLFGEVSKIIDLKQSSEPQGKIVSSVIIDKITSLIGIMVIGIAGVVFTDIKVPETLRMLFMILLLLLLVIIAAGRLHFVENIVVYSSYRLWKNTGYRIRKAGGRLYKLYVAWKYYAGRGSAIFRSILLGACSQALGIFQVWMISNSMGMRIDIIEYCWIMPAVSVILLLPVSFGGLGVREVSLSGFLALFGVASEKAIVISIILMISQLVTAVAGVIVIVYDWGRRLQRERSI